MSLILAIEPDRRQAAKVYALTDTLRVELIHGETTDTALAALGARVPDLVLTSQLLSPKDEAVLADRLRELDAAGQHVPTLVIPALRGDDGDRKKPGVGFFGRLRGKKEEKTTEGCDPAVFAAEITEYLDRSAADRAALAQAQADLEAAWAETPAASEGTHATTAPMAPAPPRSAHDEALDALFAASPVVMANAPVTPDDPALAQVDVHPDMVIEDPVALFGEFAAIPIKRGGSSEPEPVDLDSGVADDVTAQFASLFASSEQVPAPIDHAATRDVVDEPLAVTADPDPVARVAAQPEDEWEEIALDGGEAAALPADSDPLPPQAHHVELTAEPVDLDEFVRELATVRSTANAQPMIPVVDLSHVLAGDVVVPEPEVVSEMEIKEEDQAAFDAEIAAVFASEPAITVEAEPELAEDPVVAHADHASESLYASAAVDPEPRDVPDDAGRLPVPAHQSTPAPTPTVWPEFPDLKVPAWQAPVDPAPAPERWRAALQSLPTPMPMAAPAPDMSVVKEPALKPGWHDMLSAIRRDIDQGKKDEEAAAPVVKPKTDFSAEPLVFPKRPAVAAGLIANIEPPRAFKKTEVTAPAPDLNAPAAALKKLLDTVVVPKAEAAANDPGVADTAVTEAAALQAALSGLDVATVAAAEKVEPSPDLTASPVWAGGASLAASLETAIEEPVVSADVLSPERAAPELQTVDLSWLQRSAPVATEAVLPAVTPEPEPVTPSLDSMSLEELELATRPTATWIAESQTTAAAEAEAHAVALEATTSESDTAMAAPQATVDGELAAVDAASFTDVTPSEPAVMAEPAVAFEPAGAVEPPVVSEPAPAEPAVAFEPMAETNASAAAGGEGKTARSGRGKKKRKHGQAHPPQAAQPAAVQPVDEDWGFFDPHKHGFLPLLARLEQMTGQMSGGRMPLR